MYQAEFKCQLLADCTVFVYVDFNLRIYVRTMSRLIKTQTDSETGLVCLVYNFVTDAEPQSPRSCFSTRCIPNNTVSICA